jgi:hypothetical protein
MNVGVSMKKKNGLFWVSYILILVAFVYLIQLDGIISRYSSIGEIVIITICLLAVGIFFKKWFDHWYKSK